MRLKLTLQGPVRGLDDVSRLNARLVRMLDSAPGLDFVLVADDGGPPSHPSIGSLLVHRAWPGPETGFRHLLYQNWDFGPWPADWLDFLNTEVSLLLVPSTYVAESAELSGWRRELTEILPPPLCSPKTKANPRRSAKEIRLGFVGEISPLKGADLLLQAFDREFSPGRSVRLAWLPLVENVFRSHNEGLMRLLAAHPGSAIFPTPRTEEDILAFMADVDALVFPYRAEGLGLSLADALALGKPVLATGFGAAVDYLPYGVGIIPAVLQRGGLEIALAALASPAVYAEPDPEGLRQGLSLLVENLAAWRERAAEAAERLRRDRSDVVLLDRIRAIVLRSTAGIERRSPDSKAHGILWLGPFYSQGGYGEEARALAIALADQKLDLRLRPLKPETDIRPLVTAEEFRTLERLVNRNTGGETLALLHGPGYLVQRVRSRAHHIARTTFETEGLPPEWVGRLNAMDEIWVPSRFNRDGFIRAGVVAEKIRLLPEGFDESRFHPDVPPLDTNLNWRFTFLTILDWESWYRKGLDILVRAFVQEFAGQAEIGLLIKTGGVEQETAASWLKERIDRETRGHPSQAPPIVVRSQVLDFATLPSLYAAADAFVLPSRGEGWGRPLLEAMAMGKPTIGTAWGGQTMFMNQENSLLVEPEDIETITAEAAGAYFTGLRWARPSVSALRKALRRVVDEPTLAAETARRAREDALAHWTNRHMAQIALDLLKRWL